MAAKRTRSRQSTTSCPRQTFVAALLVCASVTDIGLGATSRVGRVWPIAEPDALAEIEARQAHLHPIDPNFGTQIRWTARLPASLDASQADRTRVVIPTYRLEGDIRLPDGRLLYPQGYRFNPLAYVHLTQRLIIVHSDQINWALGHASPTDWILLAAGSGKTGDPIALSNRLGRPIFVLEEAVKQRLELTVAPVIVRQIGQTLELTEVRMHADTGVSR